MKTMPFIMLALSSITATVAADAPLYRSPLQLAWLNAKTVVVSDPTAGLAYLVDSKQGSVIGEVKIGGQPTGIIAADGIFYAAETTAGTVAEVGTDLAVKGRLKLGPRPVGLALAVKSRWLVVADSGLGQVSIVDLGTGTTLDNVVVSGLPYAVAVTPDEKSALTVSRSPVGDARREEQAAVLTMIDLETRSKTLEIGLQPGTSNVTGLAVSPDGKWAYLVHTLGRFTLPTTQLDRGWVNSNALTIFSLTERKPYATMLLDSLTQGAADPWDIALSPDGQTAWITLAGVHELARVDLKTLHEWLAALTPQSRAALSYDLSAMYASKAQTRIKLPGAGPRGVAVSPDGATVAVAFYFSGQIALLDAATSAIRPISLGVQPAESEVRKGERLFHDGTLALQHWLSCATCHPDARAEGLNWDLMNDGMGNPKNTKSMLFAHKTPPAMWSGVRPTAESAVRSGFTHILFAVRPEEDLAAVDTFLKSLEPVPSPHLVDGRPSSAAERGKAIFFNKEVACARCHPSPLYTDLLMHDVDSKGSYDRCAAFDTPSLIECWRTAPYLHDGRYLTIKDLIVRGKHGGQDGNLDRLTEQQINDLVEFVLSL